LETAPKKTQGEVSVMSHAGAKRNVEGVRASLPKDPCPSFRKTYEMDGLKRLQELVSSMEKSCPLFD